MLGAVGRFDVITVSKGVANGWVDDSNPPTVSARVLPPGRQCWFGQFPLAKGRNRRIYPRLYRASSLTGCSNPMQSLATFIADAAGRPARQPGPAMVEDGQRIGPYRVIDSLGIGGMGVVYRAQHTVSKRLAAVKTVRIPSPQWLAGIRREILALTRIRHPGVVRIVAQGAHDGLPWYAMEILDGDTLRVVLRRRWGDEHSRSASTIAGSPEDATQSVMGTDGSALARPSGLPPPLRSSRGAREWRALSTEDLRSCLRVFSRLSNTLAFLHGEGIVNGDLKPENVVILPDHRPVIIDFGLTASFGGPVGREALESSRGLAGTLPYIAPEQIRNEFIDARADLYAIGCMLYEALTGTPPFNGSPTEILDHHLHLRPLPLGDLVANLPQEIEAIVLKLLEKQLCDRAGYAADVAQVLGRYANVEHDPGLPSPRPYLYRPKFSGREALIEQLREDLARGAKGEGRLVLVGGESGVGKTRFAMEATRLGRERGMRVITGECTAVSSSVGSTAVGFVPLNALKPLLQAIADHCHAEGREFADRVLGPRGPVLALYEPALAHALGQDLQPTPPPLSSEASRRRLFSYLAQTLSAFVRGRPTLMVIDDLHWADELTVAFIRWLPATFWASNPLVVQANYRPEQANLEIDAILAAPHVRAMKLERLDGQSVRQIVSDLLAGSSSALTSLVEFLSLQSEGNPFFVIEYLRAAVAAGILHRRPMESWHVAVAQSQDGKIVYEALPIPRVLRELIRQRLLSLPEEALSVLETASVIGRDADEALLLAAHGSTERPFGELIDELTTRQLLERGSDDTLRFVHDKLREVTYDAIPAARVGLLHGTVAEAILTVHRDDADLPLFWPRLGYHFARASVPDRAFEYLERAGDHARARNANDEATSLYRAALVQLDQHLLVGVGEIPGARERGSLLREAVGDLLALTGHPLDARSMYQTGLERLSVQQTLLRARLLRKIAKTFEYEHAHYDALRFYDLAEEALGPLPAGQAGEDRQSEWIRIYSDRIFTRYWLGDVPAMEELVGELSAALGEGRTPWHRALLYRARMHLTFRRSRYVIPTEGVEHARSALNECLSSGQLADLPLAHFNFAFSLFLNEDFEAADWELRSALAVAERAGDVAQQARCLTYLAINARRRHRPEEAAARLEKSRTLSTAGAMRDYIGAALATESWLAHCADDIVRSEDLARQALNVWEMSNYVYPFQWTALFQLLHTRALQDDLIAGAVCIRSLLSKRQQRLPQALTDALQNVNDAVETDNASEARRLLDGSLELSRTLGFL